MGNGRLEVKLNWNETCIREEEDRVLIGRVVEKARVGFVTVRGAIMVAWKVMGDLEMRSIGFNMFLLRYQIRVKRKGCCKRVHGWSGITCLA